jgi:hypothetical protein
MDFSKTKIMTNNLPEPINWNVIINTAMYVAGGLIAWFYFVHWYFKNKSKEKEDWVKSIATAAVNTAMDSSLKDVRADIQTLFKYREEDRRHIDHKFDSMMGELRK